MVRSSRRLRWLSARSPGASSRLGGLAVNALLRLSIAYFLWEALRHPHDPRFAGKAIPVRNLLVVGGLSLVFPAWHAWLRRQTPYPFWRDSLYLSIFWLDMAGNSFNLYNRYRHFDLLPHCHGTGALALVVQDAFDVSPARAVALANGVHGLLEAQELVTDRRFGTHNVRGAWDTAGDLAAGALGTVLYVAVAALVKARPRAGDGRT